MKKNYLIYYSNVSQRDEWFSTLMGYANKTKIGIVSNMLPIIGNLSVMENILIAAFYHHRTSYKEAVKLAGSDLKRFNMEQHMDSRSNDLSDFERFLVKYLQVRYLCPEWTVFISPRRMYVAEDEERFHEFLRCEDLQKSVIIEHASNKYLFDDVPEYKEKDYDSWVTQDLRI